MDIIVQTCKGGDIISIVHTHKMTDPMGFSETLDDFRVMDGDAMNALVSY